MALTKITGQVINDTTGLVVGVTTVGGGVSATDGFFSGIVTAVGDASFSGNVSVGGTLTYEDVTNIDAVGLVTARNGIVVGSGITLSKDGDGFFTGVVTATSYAGDGSGLTGIAATDNVRTGILDVAGVGTFRNDVNVPDKIIHLGDTDTAIRFPAADTVTVETAGSERIRITGDGPHLLLGGTTDVNEITESSSNTGMVIGSTSVGNGGLAIINSTTGTGRVYFGDATGSDAGRNRGQINYYHNGDYMMFATAGSERLRIGSSGQFGIGGATYGSSGQVLSSQGSSSAIQWAVPGLIYEGSVTSLPTDAGEVDVDVILSTAKRIEIFIFSYSVNSNDGEFVVRLRTSSGTLTTGYKGSGHYLSNTSYASSSQNTSGFKSLGLGSSSANYSGHIVLKNVNSNTWFCNGDFWNDSSATGYWVSGHVDAGATVTGVTLRNASGSFDAGTYKIIQYNTI